MVQGMLVRSIGFPEAGNEDMFSLVLFLDNLPSDSVAYIASVQKVAVFRLEAVPALRPGRS